jgi:DNA-binding PadR family transcriptional regulator
MPQLGEFETVVLLAVMHLRDTAYGTSIRDEIERRSGRAPSRGAVYITLDRLEEKGHLRSSLGEPAPERGGRPRRFYRVSARGLKAVRRSLDMLTRMREGLDPLLDPA